MSNKVNLKNYVNQYEFPFTIPSTGVGIKFKPITTGQMKNLLVYEDEGSSVVEKILDDIIVGCVISEDFILDDITLQDRFDLLIEIRKKSKGASYNFQTKCTNCGTIGPKSVNLDELENTPFVKDVPRVVKLSDTMTLEMDYVRRRSQRIAADIVDKKKNLNLNQQMAYIASYTYAMSITKFITPDGSFTQDDVNIEDVMDMLDALDENTYKKINDWFVDHDYGVQFKTSFKCPNCDTETKMEIPLSYFFS